MTKNGNGDFVPDIHEMKRLGSIKAAKCKSCAKQNNVQCPQIKKNDIQCEVSQQFRFPLWFLDTLHNHQTWDHANAAPAPPKPTTTKPGGKKAPPKKATTPKTQEEVKRELEDCADGSDDSSQQCITSGSAPLQLLRGQSKKQKTGK